MQDEEKGGRSAYPRRRGPGQAVVAATAVLVAASALGLLIWALASPGQLAWLTSISNVLAVDFAAWTASAAMLAWTIRSRKAAADDHPAQASMPGDLPSCTAIKAQGGQFGSNNLQVNVFTGQASENTASRHGTSLRQSPIAEEGRGLPVTAPLGRLPARIRGRSVVLAQLRRQLTQRRRGGTWVLAGLGGVGKSTIALATAQSALRRGWRVWWVTATDLPSLSGGMLEVLCQLDAPEAVTQPVRDGALVAAERAWAFLNGRHQAGHRWVLILDNADDPAVLAAGRTASPADYNGWLRPDPNGIVIVTTRIRDPRVWGHRIVFREIRPLDDATAGQVLTDLAPGVADQGSKARELGARLGGLPLALYLAGTYLAAPFARWHDFADYRRALDGPDLPAALYALDDPSAQARATLGRTWDLSLDALAKEGRPQSRELLHLLSCYAAATAIPGSLLRPGPLQAIFAVEAHGSAGTQTADDSERRLRDGLLGLAAAGLIDIASAGGRSADAMTVHPVVADVARSRMLSGTVLDFPALARAAVKLLDIATGELDDRHSADWPTWRQIIPHITAMLEWLGLHLNLTDSGELLKVSDRAGDAAWRSGNRVIAERLARSAMSVATRLPQDHPARLAARHSLAAAIAGNGDYREGERLYLQVLADQRRVLGHEHPDTLKTGHRLGWAIREQGRYQEAEESYRQVLSSRSRTLGDNHPDTLRTMDGLARVLGLEGRSSDAEELCRHVYIERRRILGAEHTDTLGTRHRLGLTIAAQGRHGEAERWYRELVADRQRILGADHPDTLLSRSTLAWVIGVQGRHQEAEQLLRGVLADRQRILGAGHPDTLLSRSTLAWAVGMQGRHQEAEQMCRELLADEQRMLGHDHPSTFTVSHNLARAIADQGRYQEAEELYRQVLADRRQALGDGHPDSLSTSRDLASVIGLQGRYAEAEQLYRQVLLGRQRALGDSHPDTAASHQDLERVISLGLKP